MRTGRTIGAGIAALALAAAGFGTATPAAAALTDPGRIVLDTFTVPATAESGQVIAATARVRAASGRVDVEAVTVAVRDPDGGHFDFPGARAASVTSDGYTFTTGSRTFPAGDYQVTAAVRVAGRWIGLAPRRYLTVRTNPVTFRQEFSGPAGAGPNYGLSTAMWFDDSCQEAGCDPRDTAELDGLGHLTLRPGTRLSMLDRDGNDGVAAWSQQGGHFAIRLKAPPGQGLRPVFRTVGADSAGVAWPTSGSIHVAEVSGQRPNSVWQYAHGGPPTLTYGRAHDLPGRGSSDDWHVYALDWKPGADGHLRWSVDGVATQELTASEAGAAWSSFRRPHTLALEVSAEGLRSGNRPSARTLVDWLRVHRYPVGVGGPPR